MVKSVKASDKKVQGAKKSTPKKAVKRAAAAPVKEMVAVSKKYTNPFAAYRAFWARGFTDWTGVSSRSEYWWAALVNALIVFGTFTLMWLTARNGISNGFEAFGGIILLGALALYGFAVIVPTLSMVVRRLRDGGFSPWWVLLHPVALWAPYIGYVAALLLFIFMLMPTRADRKNIK